MGGHRGTDTVTVTVYMGLRAFDTSAFDGSALGCWVKEGWDWLIMFL
jgi:hypothetical protein